MIDSPFVVFFSYTLLLSSISVVRLQLGFPGNKNVRELSKESENDSELSEAKTKMCRATISVSPEPFFSDTGKHQN